MKKSFPVLLCTVLVVAGAGRSHSRESTAAVANWLEATNFPCYGLRLSPGPKNPAGP